MSEDDIALLTRVMAEVDARKAAADAAGKEAAAAIEGNRTASASLTAAVTVLRELVAALTGGAGYDGRHPLKAARELAVALLDGEPAEAS